MLPITCAHPTPRAPLANTESGQAFLMLGPHIYPLARVHVTGEEVIRAPRIRLRLRPPSTEEKERLWELCTTEQTENQTVRVC